MAGVELYHAELFKYIGLGVVAALLVLSLGVFLFSFQTRRRLWITAQLVSVLLAAIALWFGLIVGVGAGFDAWQRAPGAGDKAYADGAQLTGSFLFGWIPAGIGATSMWSLLSLGKWYFRRERRSP